MSTMSSRSSVSGLKDQKPNNYGKKADTLQYTSKQRVYMTFSLYASFLALGMLSGITGPAFVHLSYLLETDIKTLALTHTFGSMGYLIGSFACGVIFDRFNSEIQLTLTTFGMGTAVILCPWMPTVYAYYVVDFLRNICMAYLDTSGQSYNIALWNDHRLKEPMMQGMHCVWSLGATLCPFLIMPFISELPEAQDQGNQWLNGSTNNVTIYLTNQTVYEDSTEEFESVRYYFGLVGGVTLIVSVLNCVGFCVVKMPIKKTPTTNNHVHETKQKSLPKKSKMMFLTLQYFFIFFYVLCIYLPGNYGSTFVIKGLGWSVKYGSIITSIFYGCHGLSRIVAIPVSYYVSPGKMLAFDLMFTVTAFALMAMIPLTSENIMWVAMALAGMSQGSVLPSMFLWTSNYIPMSGSVSAVFFVGGSCGIMIGGYLTGYLFQQYTYMWFVYLNLIASVGSAVFYVTMFALIKLIKKRTKAGRRSNIPEHLSMLSVTTDEKSKL